MPTVAGTWTDAELTEFLTTTTLPIRIAAHRGDGSLWMVTLWYRYHDNVLECATWTNADIVRFLRSDAELAFDISTNHPPYKGVRGNGTATISPDTNKHTLNTLIDRYLGNSHPDLADWLLTDDRDETRIRIHPEELYSWDYSDRMTDT